MTPLEPLVGDLPEAVHDDVERVDPGRRYELLGLDDQAVALAKSRWARAQERDERIAVGDALREIGVIA
ncbi:hypothetical protein [Curtobacterium sp. MCPF17_003]|uniref:hypothetical protein n=1 Tax=Curtobacterium sp. MCPF17_003 TaxID=2175637 RepID=UPI0011B80358|nr:hypothetical protein [Curtobacterium sp. MCPF17_003]